MLYLSLRRLSNFYIMNLNGCPSHRQYGFFRISWFYELNSVSRAFI